MTESGAGNRHFDILSQGLDTNTWEHSRLGIAHAELHLPYIDKTVKDLIARAEGRTCLVVSGGPSVLRRESLERLKPVIDRFIVVCADGAIKSDLLWKLYLVILKTIFSTRQSWQF